MKHGEATRKILSFFFLVMSSIIVTLQTEYTYMFVRVSLF